MFLGKDDFQSGLLFGGMLIDGDAAPVIDNRYAAIEIDFNGDISAMAGHRLVNGIVDDFVNQVMQAAHRNITDVASGARAYGLNSLQNLDVLCRVVAGGQCS